MIYTSLLNFNGKHLPSQLKLGSLILSSSTEYTNLNNGREPPPNFNKWMKFALDRGCQTDMTSYAQLFTDLSPWFKLGRIELFDYHDASNIHVLSFTPGSMYKFGIGNKIKDLFDFPSERKVLDAIVHLLPEKAFTFAINKWDEPLSLPASDGSLLEYKAVQDVMEHNACMSSHNASRMHGFFNDPDSFVARNAMIPIFSQAKISCFQDILIPLAYHIDSETPPFVEWKEKLNVLFWRGANTGGRYSTTTRWKSFQRTALLNWELAYRQSHAESIIDLGLTTNHETLDQTRMMVDIGLHRIVQADETTKSQLIATYGLKATVDFKATLKFKYLLVVDGNTWPARLQSYLATNSVILYSGIFTDWFNWKLVPFEHYIPVALDFSDLDERLAWLIKNDDKARQIAINARAFMQRYSKIEEMQCYTGLALLEYSRLYRHGIDE